jgi:hypothetical protein
VTDRYTDPLSAAFVEMAGGLRRGDLGLPRDPELFEELEALTLRVEVDGRIRVPIEEAEARLGRRFAKARAAATAWSK